MAALQGSSAVPPGQYPPTIAILDLPLAEEPAARLRSAASARASFAWLRQQPELVERGQCHASTTAPDRPKTGVARGRSRHPRARPSRLAELSDSRRSLQCCSPPAPPTEPGDSTPCCPPTHIPWQRCPAARPRPGWERKPGRCCWPSAVRFVPNPGFVVAGLNPHAGESELLGCEGSRTG